MDDIQDTKIKASQRIIHIYDLILYMEEGGRNKVLEKGQA